MSSDFYINYYDLLEADLVESLEIVIEKLTNHDFAGNEHTSWHECQLIKLRDYDYKRACELSSTVAANGNRYLHLSCSGAFRTWLRAYLDDKNIEYVME